MSKQKKDFEVRYKPGYTRKRCKSCLHHGDTCHASPMDRACSCYVKR